MANSSPNKKKHGDEQSDISLSDESIDDFDSDPMYVVTQEDRRMEKFDLVADEEGGSAFKRVNFVFFIFQTKTIVDHSHNFECAVFDFSHRVICLQFI